MSNNVSKKQLLAVLNTHSLEVLDKKRGIYKADEVTDDMVSSFNTAYAKFKEKYPDFKLMGDDYNGEEDDAFIRLLGKWGKDHGLDLIGECLENQETYSILDLEAYINYHSPNPKKLLAALAEHTLAASDYLSHADVKGLFESFGLPFATMDKLSRYIFEKKSDECTIVEGETYIMEDGERRFKFSVEEVDDETGNITGRDEKGKGYKTNKEKMAKAIKDGHAKKFESIMTEGLTESQVADLEAGKKVTIGDGEKVFLNDAKAVDFEIVGKEVKRFPVVEDFVNYYNNKADVKFRQFNFNEKMTEELGMPVYVDKDGVQAWYDGDNNLCESAKDLSDDELLHTAENIAKRVAPNGGKMAITEDEFLDQCEKENITGKHNEEGVKFHLAKMKIPVLVDELCQYKEQMVEMLDEGAITLIEGKRKKQLEKIIHKYRKGDEAKIMAILKSDDSVEEKATKIQAMTGGFITDIKRIIEAKIGSQDMAALASSYNINTMPGLEGLSWLMKHYGNIDVKSVMEESIIGHTRNGKPIYKDRNAEDYTDFSKNDHIDAAWHHNEHSKTASGKQGNSKSAIKHKDIASKHSQLSLKEDVNGNAGGMDAKIVVKWKCKQGEGPAGAYEKDIWHDMEETFGSTDAGKKKANELIKKLESQTKSVKDVTHNLGDEATNEAVNQLSDVLKSNINTILADGESSDDEKISAITAIVGSKARARRIVKTGEITEALKPEYVTKFKNKVQELLNKGVRVQTGPGGKMVFKTGNATGDSKLSLEEAQKLAFDNLFQAGEIKGTLASFVSKSANESLEPWSEAEYDELQQLGYEFDGDMFAWKKYPRAENGEDFDEEVYIEKNKDGSFTISFPYSDDKKNIICKNYKELISKIKSGDVLEAKDVYTEILTTSDLSSNDPNLKDVVPASSRKDGEKIKIKSSYINNKKFVWKGDAETGTLEPVSEANESEYDWLKSYKIVGNYHGDSSFFNKADKFIRDTDADMKQRAEIVKKYDEAMGLETPPGPDEEVVKEYIDNVDAEDADESRDDLHDKISKFLEITGWVSIDELATKFEVSKQRIKAAIKNMDIEQDDVRGVKLKESKENFGPGDKVECTDSEGHVTNGTVVKKAKDGWLVKDGNDAGAIFTEDMMKKIDEAKASHKVGDEMKDPFGDKCKIIAMGKWDVVSKFDSDGLMERLIHKGEVEDNADFIALEDEGGTTVVYTVDDLSDAKPKEDDEDKNGNEDDDGDDDDASPAGGDDGDTNESKVFNKDAWSKHVSENLKKGDVIIANGKRRIFESYGFTIAECKGGNVFLGMITYHKDTAGNKLHKSDFIKEDNNGDDDPKQWTGFCKANNISDDDRDTIASEVHSAKSGKDVRNSISKIIKDKKLVNKIFGFWVLNEGANGANDYEAYLKDSLEKGDSVELRDGDKGKFVEFSPSGSFCIIKVKGANQSNHVSDIISHENSQTGETVTEKNYMESLNEESQEQAADEITTPQQLGTALKKWFKEKGITVKSTRYIKTVKGLDGSYYEVCTGKWEDGKGLVGDVIPNDIRKKCVLMVYGKKESEFDSMNIKTPDNITYGNITPYRISMAGRLWKKLIGDKEQVDERFALTRDTFKLNDAIEKIDDLSAKYKNLKISLVDSNTVRVTWAPKRYSKEEVEKMLSESTIVYTTTENLGNTDTEKTGAVKMLAEKHFGDSIKVDAVSINGVHDDGSTSFIVDLSGDESTITEKLNGEWKLPVLESANLLSKLGIDVSEANKWSSFVPKDIDMMASVLTAMNMTIDDSSGEAKKLIDEFIKKADPKGEMSLGDVVKKAGMAASTNLLSVLRKFKYNYDDDLWKNMEAKAAEQMKEVKTIDLKVGKTYSWTGGAEHLEIKYLGTAKDNPELEKKCGSSQGKGFIFQWMHQKDKESYLELGRIAIDKSVEEIDADKTDENKLMAGDPVTIDGVSGMILSITEGKATIFTDDETVVITETWNFNLRRLDELGPLIGKGEKYTFKDGKTLAKKYNDFNDKEKMEMEEREFKELFKNKIYYKGDYTLFKRDGKIFVNVGNAQPSAFNDIQGALSKAKAA